MYYSTVYPHLQYCNLVWGSAMKTIVNPLLLLQKRIIKIISSVGYREHTDHLFNEHAILRINDIHRLELFKFVHFELKSPTILLFSRVATIHSQNLRNSNLFRLPQIYFEACKRFVCYSRCIAWNSLPEQLKVIENSVTFRIKTKKYILDENA